MRSANIDPKRFINICVAQGVITKEEALEAIREGAGMRGADKQLKLTDRFGGVRDEHGHLGSVFLATHKPEDGGGIRYSRDEKRVRCNFRFQTAKKQQAAATPGQVLGGQQGVPAALANLTPEAMELLRAFLGQGQQQVEAEEEDMDLVL